MARRNDRTARDIGIAQRADEDDIDSTPDDEAAARDRMQDALARYDVHVAEHMKAYGISREQAMQDLRRAHDFRDDVGGVRTKEQDRILKNERDRDAKKKRATSTREAFGQAILDERKQLATLGDE